MYNFADFCFQWVDFQKLIEQNVIILTGHNPRRDVINNIWIRSVQSFRHFYGHNHNQTTQIYVN